MLIRDILKNHFHVHTDLNFGGLALHYLRHHPDAFLQINHCQHVWKIGHELGFNHVTHNCEGVHSCPAARLSPAQFRGPAVWTVLTWIEDETATFLALLDEQLVLLCGPPELLGPRLHSRYRLEIFSTHGSSLPHTLAMLFIPEPPEVF